jgi:signal transduction histidine kinase
LRIFSRKEGIQPLDDYGSRVRYPVKAGNGQLFFGDDNGYNAFFPDSLKEEPAQTLLTFTDVKANNRELSPGPGGALTEPAWKATGITLNYQENTFSIGLLGFDYTDPGKIHYQAMLENYDNLWRDMGLYSRADYFNIPPGKYVFHARAVNTEGGIVEKTMSVVILPPWWRTGLAFAAYSLLLLMSVYFAFRLFKAKVLRVERELSREKELVQAREIEKAYKELKSTQARLIQSEKMASLGQLTAGIAHEIKNPLNFVNNFSGLNRELAVELREELDSGNIGKARAITMEIEENEGKIIHHGQRADAIVNSMLLHSAKNTGDKEATDINTMVDESLRLAFHGFRAKDKGFNATLKTDLDESIDKVDTIPQEIGRVLLNVFNNALYAVSERSELKEQGYEPTISVSTRKQADGIEINVADNGIGIPENVKDRIFEPFFTTKPTGKGAGLGLSLSYEIVKAHGGEIRVVANPGGGALFQISLPFKAK